MLYESGKFGMQGENFKGEGRDSIYFSCISASNLLYLYSLSKGIKGY